MFRLTALLTACTLLFLVHGIGCQMIFPKSANLSSPEKRWLLQFQEHYNVIGGNSTDFDNVKGERADDDSRVFYEEPPGQETSWFTKIPYLTTVFAESPYLPEGPCKRQTRRYLRDLKNGTLWAARMFDASTKYPDGIIAGYTRHLGNFDECYRLQVDVPSEDVNSGTERIAGKYCLVDVKYQRKDMPPIEQGPHNLQFDPNDSVWEALREKGDIRRVKRYLLQLALCVPSVCTTEDIQVALQKPLEEMGAKYNVALQTQVMDRKCQTLAESPTLSTGAKVFFAIIFVLTFLVIISTWYDGSLNSEESEEDSALRDFLLCFSARRNLKNMMEVRYSHPGLDCIHMMRFFFMTLVIVGHRSMQYFSNPVINAEYLELSYTVRSAMMLYNGPIIVDGFFAIGGLLVAHCLLEELDKSKRINIVPLILIRFIRLTPAYMFLILFNATVLPSLGSGPFWKEIVEAEGSFCRNNWWTNLLYVNNYISEKNLCMFQTWYLTVDFHLYVIALAVLYAFWRMPRRIGYTFLGLFTLATCILPFYESYVHRAPPVFRGLPPLRDVRESKCFTDYYIKTHLRMTSYFVGVISGAIIYDHRHSTWRLPKVWSRILFILLCVVMSFTSQAMAHKYFDPNSKQTPLETALYAAFHRGFFATSMIAAVVLITVGEGLEFHYNFLNPVWIQPLGRLTYGAFLIHHTSQMYDAGVARTGRVFALHNLVWDLIPDMVFTFSLALLLVIGIEGPFRQLEKRFIMGKKSKNITSRTVVDTVAKKVS